MLLLSQVVCYIPAYEIAYYLKGEMLFKPLIQSYMCKPVQSTKYKPPYANLSFNISSAQGSIKVHHLKILFAGISFPFRVLIH